MKLNGSNKYDQYFRKQLVENDNIVQEKDTLYRFLTSTFSNVSINLVKDNIINYENVEMIIDFVNCKQRKYKSVIFDNVGWNFLAMHIPTNYKRCKVVNSYKDCREIGDFAAYFSKVDFFGLFIGVNCNDIRVNYANDYLAYVSATYSIADCVKMYLNYLDVNQMELKVGLNTWGNPRYFVDTMRRQIEMYGRIIRQHRDSFYHIIGDGPGTASIACIIEGVEYSSSEPNQIAQMAKELGIVRLKKYEGKKKILFLANIAEYVDISSFVKNEEKVIVIDERRCFEGQEMLVPVPDSDRLVWTKGIEVEFYNRIAKCEKFLEARAPITPMDYKSKVYVEERGIEQNDNGFKISYTRSNIPDVLCIRDMGIPASMKYSRKGEIKRNDGVEFKFTSSAQVVVTENTLYEYYPIEVGDSRILEQKSYWKNEDYYVSHVKNPQKVRKVRDGGSLISVYLIAVITKRGRKESYFRTSNLNIESYVREMAKIKAMDEIEDE